MPQCHRPSIAACWRSPAGTSARPVATHAPVQCSRIARTNNGSLATIAAGVGAADPCQQPGVRSRWRGAWLASTMDRTDKCFGRPVRATARRPRKYGSGGGCRTLFRPPGRGEPSLFELRSLSLLTCALAGPCKRRVRRLSRARRGVAGHCQGRPLHFADRIGLRHHQWTEDQVPV